MKRVEILDVSRSYGKNRALSGVSLSLVPGEVTGFVGPNGAGKTTLLKLLAGLLRPEKGKILYDGSDGIFADPARRSRTIGYLPQFQMLNWPIPGRELVALGRLPHAGAMGGRDKAGERMVGAALARCGAEAYADKSVLSLSGGEQAMLLLARLLATDADVLLVDEPFTSLDPSRQLKVAGILQEEAQKGKLVVIIAHDLTLALRTSRRLVLFQAGGIAAEGEGGAVLTRENLARVFHVDAEFGRTGKGAYIIPTEAIAGTG